MYIYVNIYILCFYKKLIVYKGCVLLFRKKIQDLTSGENILLDSFWASCLSLTWGKQIPIAKSFELCSQRRWQEEGIVMAKGHAHVNISHLPLA